jgi:hypothetical protein
MSTTPRQSRPAKKAIPEPARFVFLFSYVVFSLTFFLAVLGREQELLPPFLLLPIALLVSNLLHLLLQSLSLLCLKQTALAQIIYRIAFSSLSQG